MQLLCVPVLEFSPPLRRCSTVRSECGDTPLFAGFLELVLSLLLEQHLLGVKHSLHNSNGGKYQWSMHTEESLIVDTLEAPLLERSSQLAQHNNYVNRHVHTNLKGCLASPPFSSRCHRLLDTSVGTGEDIFPTNTFHKFHHLKCQCVQVLTSSAVTVCQLAVERGKEVWQKGWEGGGA